MTSDFSTLRPLHPLHQSSRMANSTGLSHLSSEFRGHGFKDPLSSFSSPALSQSTTPDKHARRGSHGEIVALTVEEIRGNTVDESVRLGFIVHKLTKLDTLAGLAIKYGVQVEQLKRFNRLTLEMQMFALGEVKIPLSGDAPPLPSPGPTPSPNRGTAGTPTKDGSRAPKISPAGTGPSGGGAAAAAAVAAGRQAAAAASQLVESIDPELLLGVKGLRTAAEGSPNEEGDRGAAKGAKAAALLLALQQRSSRTSSLGMGISVEPDNPLARLTQSPSFDRYEEESKTSGWQAGAWLQGRAPGRSSAGQLISTQSSSGVSVGARRSLPFGQGRRPDSESASFWEHEFRGEEQTLFASAPGEVDGMEAQGLSGVTPTTLIGHKGEQVRRRGGGGRGSGEEGSGLSSGEDDGPGWMSADEYSSTRADAAMMAGMNSSGRTTRGKAGNLPRGAMQGENPRRQGSLRAGNGSVSYESLNGLRASGTVSVAAHWGTKVIDNLLSQFRHSGAWFVERPDHSSGGGLKGEGRGEVGIDLPVMSRSGGSMLVGSGGSAAPLGGGLDKEQVTSWASGAASASSTTRRSSKGKASLD